MLIAHSHLQFSSKYRKFKVNTQCISKFNIYRVVSLVQQLIQFWRFIGI